MQELLAKRREASLRVYVVWYAMYPGAARDKWRRDLLPDPRAVHWWDEQRAVGREMLTILQPYANVRAAGSREFDGDILWDAYLLFDHTARWDKSPGGLVSWGYTVMATRQPLQDDLFRLLKAPSGRGGN